MKSPNLHPINPLPVRIRPYGAMFVAGSLVLAFGLGACSKQEEAKTTGQQVDSAMAKGEEAAAKAKADVETAATNAGSAIKSAAEDASSSAKDAAATIEGKIDDASITTSVSAAIAKDADVSVFKIDVDTKDGTVTLKGSAPTEAAREKAGNIAKAVKGVNSVDNQLVVKAG